MTVRYLLARFGQAIVVLLLTYTAVFFLLNVLPSDPVSLRYAEIAAPGSEEYARLNAYYGYDRPLWTQYVTQLGQLLQGQLGYSLENGMPVGDRIIGALPPTIGLTLLTLGIALLIAGGAGLLAFLGRGTWLLTVVRAIPPITSALPVYWTGLLLIQFGSYQLGLFSALATDGFPSTLAAAVSLAVPISAAITQSFVASIGEFSAAPFVEVVRARGATSWDIFLRYGVKSVAIPALTVVAVTFGTLMTSTIVTETVFSRTGVGSLVQRAVLGQDIPVVQGVVIFAAAVYIVVNLLVDLAAFAIDPRLRSEQRRSVQRSRTVQEVFA